MKPKLELEGLRFDRWLVLRKTGAVKARGDALWLCRCDCGTEREVVAQSLSKGLSRSCGCLAIEAMNKSVTTHGLSGTRLHGIWKNMRRRCLVPANPSYPNYGGRGITICDQWSDFSVFHKWAMAGGYSDQLTIERLDVDKGYSPENCSWIPRSEQSHNQRRTARRGDGNPWHLVAVSNGIGRKTYSARVGYGWSHEDAATRPLGWKRGKEPQLSKQPSK